jgi:hypothetical protein
LEIPQLETLGLTRTKMYEMDNAGQAFVLDFFSESDTIQARLNCPSGMRIIDLLNRADDASPGRNLFLELIDANVGEATYFRKDTIQFVAAGDVNAGRGFGAVAGHSHYPVVEKLPVRVNIELKSYRLIGQAYQMKNRSLKAMLAENAVFLPITDVIIMRESKLIGEKPFVAVNKRQIISLKKDLIS